MLRTVVSTIAQEREALQRRGDNPDADNNNTVVNYTQPVRCSGDVKGIKLADTKTALVMRFRFTSVLSSLSSYLIACNTQQSKDSGKAFVLLQ